jgi:hypothetical protein
MPWEWAVLARWALSAETMPSLTERGQDPDSSEFADRGTVTSDVDESVPVTVPEDSSTATTRPPRRVSRAMSCGARRKRHLVSVCWTAAAADNCVR